MRSKTRSRVLLTLVLIGMCVFGVVLGFIAYSVSIPAGSPKARMSRTEAELTLLKTALDTYKTDHGVYPPAGQSGLRMATKHLSRNVNYITEEETRDGWDQPFVYAPSAAYATEGSGALEVDGKHFAPDTYQLYSIGMDGDAGLNATDKRADNITSWEPDHPWRKTYQRRHQDYFYERGTRQ
ncbi:MAG: type II secretion system protein GspG [Candidatus Hydrogenedentes bacterium]|nr:type II secretion system protein GspG [Candidatus Hydrogenedentota bacterium]